MKRSSLRKPHLLQPIPAVSLFPNRFILPLLWNSSMDFLLFSGTPLDPDHGQFGCVYSELRPLSSLFSPFNFRGWSNSQFSHSVTKLLIRPGFITSLIACPG
jgi:hypothetical protein